MPRQRRIEPTPERVRRMLKGLRKELAALQQREREVREHIAALERML